MNLAKISKFNGKINYFQTKFEKFDEISQNLGKIGKI